MEEAGNDNISKAHSDEVELKSRLQQTEVIPESLLDNDSEFIIDKTPRIPFMDDDSTYRESDTESPLPS